MHLLAYNYFNIDPGNNMASTTLAMGGSIFADLSPIWTIILSVGVVGLFITILVIAIHPGK